MSEGQVGAAIAAGRLAPEDYARNFSDLHPPLDRHEAFVEADRCYFCFDAPCQHACPTGIDIPLFIRQILTDTPLASAETILSANIFGGMCARVCPVETLCEEACVREYAEGKPVKIGMLQRYATDAMMRHSTETGTHPFSRAPSTGKRVAVVGAGPAGLSCAHRLAMLGHAVTVFEARSRPGGLNEYGIAQYKTPGEFAQDEVDFVLGIGGIEVREGQALGRDVSLADLRRDFDAVFLGMGLQGVNALRVSGEATEGSHDAVTFIAALRQADDLAALPIGARVVVVGGGMTAIDAAVQSRRLGAEEVTILYRGPREAMKASVWEQELAKSDGVVIRTNMRPVRILEENGRVIGIEAERTDDGGARTVFPADQVMKAIGQQFLPDGLDPDALVLSGGRIAIDAERRTSIANVWAGGDCIAGGKDLTVAAVEDGKRAAESIDRALAG